MKRILVLLAALSILSISSAFADRYCNSTTESAIQTACLAGTATGPNNGVILMTDDFEDGSWYVTNADSPSPGRDQAPNDGWDGSIDCAIPADNFTATSGTGSAGAVGTATTARGSQKATGYGSCGNGWHRFAPGVSGTRYDEIYHRFYTKPSSDYQFGHEKWVFYLGSVDTSSTSELVLLGTQGGSNTFDMLCLQCDSWRNPNQGVNLGMTVDHWYYVEVHIKLNTSDNVADGVLEYWMDDCGTNGLGCTGNGTLRLSHSNVCIRCSSNPVQPSFARTLGEIWQENYCSSGPVPQCLGQPFNDQVVVSTQRIGPMAAAGGSTYSTGASGVFLMQGVVTIK